MAEAQLSNAQTNVTRDTPLVAQNAIPRKQLDNDLAMLAANQAQLDATKAQMVQAQLNLAWTKVHSPMIGGMLAASLLVIFFIPVSFDVTCRRHCCSGVPTCNRRSKHW